MFIIQVLKLFNELRIEFIDFGDVGNIAAKNRVYPVRDSFSYSLLCIVLLLGLFHIEVFVQTVDT